MRAPTRAAPARRVPLAAAVGAVALGLPLIAVLAFITGGSAERAASAVSCAGPAHAAPGAGHCIPGPRLRVRASGRELSTAWRGSFVPGGSPGWTERQAVRGGIRSVRAAGGTRPQVGLFSVGPGDAPVRSGERAEVVASTSQTGGSEGSEAWYVWSTYFPRSAFRPVPDSTWNIFTQWHGSEPDGCSPNVAFQVNTRPSPPRLRLAVRGGRLASGSCNAPHDHSWDFAPLREGRWHDFALHVRWSSEPRRGFVELAMDGRMVVSRSSRATLYAGQQVYLKQGFYREPAGFTSRVYHSGVTRLRSSGADR